MRMRLSSLKPLLGERSAWHSHCGVRGMSFLTSLYAALFVIFPSPAVRFAHATSPRGEVL